jgi:hypothetical protein
MRPPGLDVNDPRLYMSATLTAQWLASFLNELDEERAALAVERLTTLANAPDSQRAIEGVAAILGAASTSRHAKSPEPASRKEPRAA